MIGSDVMRVIIQRVNRASVTIDGKVEGKCERGFMILWGATHGDCEEDCEYLANKCCKLRIFEDENGKMNTALSDIGGQILVVPNFTLYADSKKGYRPSFSEACEPQRANELFEYFKECLKNSGIHTECGVFGADMTVSIENDGPVTLIIESKNN